MRVREGGDDASVQRRNGSCSKYMSPLLLRIALGCNVPSARRVKKVAKHAQKPATFLRSISRNGRQARHFPIPCMPRVAVQKRAMCKSKIALQPTFFALTRRCKNVLKISQSLFFSDAMNEEELKGESVQKLLEFFFADDGGDDSSSLFEFGTPGQPSKKCLAPTP